MPIAVLTLCAATGKHTAVLGSRPWFARWFGWKEYLMAQHSSLKSASKIVEKRNVLKRFERIDLLKGRGKWKEGDRALGLPKTKPE
jgi:small basic protein (TIGR04137 family)